jgi:hypothetical protein
LGFDSRPAAEEVALVESLPLAGREEPLGDGGVLGQRPQLLDVHPDIHPECHSHQRQFV